MMDDKRRLGKFVKPDGEVIGEAFAAPNALQGDADLISRDLYSLSELLIRGLMPEARGGFLGGEFGYGVSFENDVFLMHPECWCEKNDGTCLWCLHGDHPDFERLLREKFRTTEYDKFRDRHYYDPPNFWHKPSDFRVKWYKWIGRSMATTRDVTFMEWTTIIGECRASIPTEARKKYVAERAHENTVEYRTAREEGTKRMVEALRLMDEAMRPCFRCSNDPRVMFINGRTETAGGMKLNSTLMKPDGSCPNCGHVTTKAEAMALAARRRAMDRVMLERFGGG